MSYAASFLGNAVQRLRGQSGARPRQKTLFAAERAPVTEPVLLGSRQPDPAQYSAEAPLRPHRRLQEAPSPPAAESRPARRSEQPDSGSNTVLEQAIIRHETPATATPANDTPLLAVKESVSVPLHETTNTAVPQNGLTAITQRRPTDISTNETPDPAVLQARLPGNTAAEIRQPPQPQKSPNTETAAVTIQAPPALVRRRQTEAPRVATVQPQTRVDAPPPIQVSIGRIEVHSERSAAAVRQPKTTRKSALALDRYLQQRNRGER